MAFPINAVERKKMLARFGSMLVLASCLAAAGAAHSQDAKRLRVLQDRSVTGFTFPESVGCDPSEKVLYVSQFGGTELKPADKDGKGFISR